MTPSHVAEAIFYTGKSIRELLKESPGLARLELIDRMTPKYDLRWLERALQGELDSGRIVEEWVGGRLRLYLAGREAPDG